MFVNYKINSESFNFDMPSGLQFVFVINFALSNKSSEDILKMLDKNKTLSSFSLEFCLSFLEVSVVISGINKMEYLKEYLNINYHLENNSLLLEKLNQITYPFKY